MIIRTHLAILLLIGQFFACKTRQESSVKDLTVMGGRDHVGFAYLAVRPQLPAQTDVSVKVDRMSVYAMDPGGLSTDPVYMKLSDILSENLSEGGYVEREPITYLDMRTTTLRVSEENFILPLPARNNLSLNFGRHGDAKTIAVGELELFSWRSCPFDMTSKTNAFARHLKSKLPKMDLVVGAPKYPEVPARPGSISDAMGEFFDSPLRVANLRFTSKAIGYKLSCRFPAKFAGIDHEFHLRVDADVSLQFARDVFVVPQPDPKFERLNKSKNLTERGGRGTRYFYDDADTGAILRWNPKRRPIVIDDVADGRGVELKASAIGREMARSYKFAVDDLRRQFPELGQRIVLLSEAADRKSSQTHITASFGDEILGAAGMAGIFYEDTTGEIAMARVSLGRDANHARKRIMLEKFKELGLVSDVESDMSAFIQYTVMHELGHALGLRHNFRAISTDKNGKTTFAAIMSYAYLGIPLSLLDFKPQFLPHDILSLKYLYADLLPNPSQSREQLLVELMKFPLSEDEGATFFGGDHLSSAAEFYAYSNHPKVRALRAKLGDEKYFESIAAVFEAAYQSKIEFPGQSTKF